ncbi:unnamed protein product [Cylicocyclus nassatus]|uniref:Uncharacterized protein n=1 Tax=Cylicocyclus nassatus TaxID=53992 RepID=A0AA36HAF5_CYLNA|nr:unnamed protein product [Cylicocyclus nassatus]
MRFIFLLLLRHASKSVRDLDWVPPPPEEWSKKEIEKDVKRYWELEWSKSKHLKECADHVLQIIPVYFWPGERVDLPCYMCELAMAYNGKVKYWAMAEDMIEFLTAPQLNVVMNKALYDIVENDVEKHHSKSNDVPAYKMVNLAMNNGNARIEMVAPIFLQRNGKLSILNAGVTSQGVYFCYDELSLGITNVFYVLLAMIPPVSIVDSKITKETADAYGDGCGEATTHIMPSFNWRFRFQPTFRDEKPTHCVSGSFCGGYKEVAIVGVHNATNKTFECSLDGCRVNVPPLKMPTATFDPGLDIELRWEQWTSCEGNVPSQRREAHCYLVARPGFEVDENAEDLASTIDQYIWMVKISQLVHTDSLRSTGIRLYSSFVASALYREEYLTGCADIEEGVLVAADDIWRKYFLLPMGVVQEDGKPIDQEDNEAFTLRSPFQACLRYEKASSTDEIIIGTYMTETRDCP